MKNDKHSNAETSVIIPLSPNERNQMIRRFSELYQAGMDAWTDAGKIIVKLVDDDPFTYDYIMRENPQLTSRVLQVFEKIGRGQLHPPLAMDNSPGSVKLRSLPLSQQIKYEDERIPLVVRNDRGETDMMLVLAKDMTRDQARQAFANGRIRTVGEQAAILAEMRTKKAPTAGESEPAWRIKAGRVIFREGTSLSAGELATIIAQLTK